VLNVEDCENVFDDDTLMRKILGRKKLVALAINQIPLLLQNQDYAGKKKDEILREALVISYDLIMYSLSQKLDEAIVQNSYCLKILKRIIYQCIFKKRTQIKLLKEEIGNLNVLDIGISTLIPNPDRSGSYLAKITEIIAIDACVKYLGTKWMHEEAIANCCLLLHLQLQFSGNRCKEKGNPLAALVLTSLTDPEFQEKNISELPFISGTREKPHFKNGEVPSWMKEVKFHCQLVGYSQQLGCKSDIDCLQEIITKQNSWCLIPEDKMHPCGLLIFKNPENQKFYFIVFGFKSSFEKIDKATSEKNLSQTDLRRCYLTENNSPDPKAKYDAFHTLFQDELKDDLEERRYQTSSSTSVISSTKKVIGGILRILVEIPTGHSSNKDLLGTTSGLTTFLYIDNENLDQLVRDKESQSVIRSIFDNKEDF